MYVAELRKLSTYCEYGNSLNEMLRDRIVCGINDSRIQRRLLAERDLTFDKALDTAQAMEAAEKNVKDLKGSIAREEVHAINDFSNSRGRNTAKECKHCGKRNHREQDCRHRNAECFRCHRKGHLQVVCKKTTETRTDETNWMRTEVQDETLPEYDLF